MHTCSRHAFAYFAASSADQTGRLTKLVGVDVRAGGRRAAVRVAGLDSSGDDSSDGQGAIARSRM